MPSTAKCKQTPKNSCCGILWHCETKNSRRTNVVPLLMHQIFQFQKLSETQKGSPYFLSVLSGKKLTKNLTTTFKQFFDSRSFQQHQKRPLTNFSKDKKFSRFSGMPPLHGSIKTSHTTNGRHQKLSQSSEIFRITKLAPLLNFWSCETKSFRLFLVTPSNGLPTFLRQTQQHCHFSPVVKFFWFRAINFRNGK